MPIKNLYFKSEVWFPFGFAVEFFIYFIRTKGSNEKVFLWNHLGIIRGKNPGTLISKSFGFLTKK